MENEQQIVFGALGVLAVVAGCAWGYTLANQPPPEVLPEQEVVSDPGNPELYYANAAKLKKRRWIRCDLQGAPETEADVHLLEPGVYDGTLYAFVHTVSGSSMLHGAEETRQVLWHDAKKGGEGKCSVRVPVPVTLEGTVMGASSGTLVSTCSEETAEVDAQGHFSVGGLQGHPCTLWFVGGGTDGDLMARMRLTAERSVQGLSLEAKPL